MAGTLHYRWGEKDPKETGNKNTIHFIERSQFRWFEYLVRMPPERFPGEVFLLSPAGRRSQGRTTQWRDYIYILAWECLRMKMEWMDGWELVQGLLKNVFTIWILHESASVHHTNEWYSYMAAKKAEHYSNWWHCDVMKASNLLLRSFEPQLFSVKTHDGTNNTHIMLTYSKYWNQYQLTMLFCCIICCVEILYVRI